MLDATRQRPGDPWFAVWTSEILRVLGGLTNVLQGGRLTEPVVHKSRRELKRLRSLLRLAPASLGDLADDTREVTGELRRRLGHSRDATVMLKTLNSFSADLGEAASRINPVLSAHHRQASAMLDRRSRRWDRDRMARFGALWRASPIQGDARDLCKGAVKTYRRARQQAIALGKGKDAALHPLRKACVDHQNHLAFFALGAKGKIGSRHGKLKRLRDQLGLCHDLEVLCDFVRTRADISASDLIHLEDVLMRRHGQLVQKAVKSAAILFAGKSRQFEKWIRREVGKTSIAAFVEPSRPPVVVPPDLQEHTG
ncbi:MAG: CHAD domain-containing protein [Hyphomicrobiales bacterium]|nr:CHAD domain-containing protein [Hyphomicrobiales bacterium]MBV9568198.1 CHAD domain-containing protein [Hyphomicrobiales bacterium]